MMLVTVAATGFSQTLLVSAKPVIMFGKIDGVTYRQGDLLRLSSVLAPVHLALIGVYQRDRPGLTTFQAISRCKKWFYHWYTCLFAPPRYLRRAKRRGVPVIALVGTVGEGAEATRAVGIE